MADVTQGSPSNQPVSQKKPPQAGRASAADALNVRDPDALQEGMLSFWHLLEQNSTAVLGLIVIVVMAAGGYTVRNWWVARTEKQAQDAYYSVEAKYTKLKEGFDRAKMKEMMPAAVAKDEKNPVVPASGDLAKDYGSILADFEKVARDNPATAAGAQAAIVAADLYMTHDQTDKAVEIAQVPAKALGAKTLMGSLATVTWGSALASKGDCREAIKVWQQVLDNASVAFLHGDASLRSGLCYESLNEPDKAREMYRKVTSQGEDSAAGTTAKGLLRALDAKSKPAAVPPTKG